MRKEGTLHEDRDPAPPCRHYPPPAADVRHTKREKTINHIGEARVSPMFCGHFDKGEFKIAVYRGEASNLPVAARTGVKGRSPLHLRGMAGSAEGGLERLGARR